MDPLLDESVTGMELCIPASSLAIDGADPEEGDAVNFTVDGTVTRVADGNVYIKPDRINDEAVLNTAAPFDEDAQLLDMASEADKETYGE